MRAPARRSRSLRLPSRRPPIPRFQWVLSRLREGKPFQAVDLARAFEVQVRTAYRDIAMLQDQLKVPFDYDPSARTYRLTEPMALLPGMPFSASELVAIYFAEKVLAQYRGTSFEPTLLSAFTKITSLLPGDMTVVTGAALPYLSLDIGPQPQGDPAIFRDVVDGLAKRRRLVVRYKSLASARTTDRTLEPYQIFNIRGDWYVAAFDHRRRQVRDFALHRIRRVTITDEPYERDPAFDFKKYMADALSIEKGGRIAEVAIRFAERQARWIRERRWHRSARVEDSLDGGCVLRMRVAVTSELRRWVMQFGSEAEVLAPALFRKAVAEELRIAVAPYAGRKERR